jgi:hypothetical protein
MSGAIPPLPQHAFMAWCLVKAEGQLYLLVLFMRFSHSFRFSLPYSRTLNKPALSLFISVLVHLEALYMTATHFVVRVTLQLTVSPSVLALSPSGTHDQILAAFKTVAVLFGVGRPP